MMADANFPLVQFSKFSIGSVFPTMSGLVPTFMHGYGQNIYVWTFMHDDLSVLKSAKKNPPK